MPVTTQAAPVEVKAYPGAFPTVSAKKILKQTCPEKYADCAGILDSSFSKAGNIQSSHNGFIMCALDAYLQHNHLILRPEDLWFAILTQFSFYVNKHSEKLRSFFVAHKGKKKLQILQEPPLDLEQLVLDMTDLIAKNIKDPALRTWVMPSFTTTTATDKVVAAILMMGTMQKYFAYFGGITCGIPSVTLLGEKKDWENILERLEFLATIKEQHELQLWYKTLKPIVANFVRTFEAPNSQKVADFWSKTVHQHIDNYSGEKQITGWILAFCFWDAQGEPLIANSMKHPAQAILEKNDVSNKTDIETIANQVSAMEKYGELSWDSVPSGFAHVPIHIKINPANKYTTTAIAGSVGWRLLDSEKVLQAEWKSAKAEEKEEDPLCMGRAPVEPVSDEKGVTAVSFSATRPGAMSTVRKVLRKLLCLPSPSPPPSSPPKLVTPTEKKLSFSSSSASSSIPTSSASPSSRTSSSISKAKTVTKSDTLQPVAGWWIIKSKSGTYGKDSDVPDVQFDSDAEDYDEDLAVNGRPL